MSSAVIWNGEVKQSFQQNRRGAVRSTPMIRKSISVSSLRCRRKFLRLFPKGFADETYLSWERDYKWETHERWQDALSQEEFSRLLAQWLGDSE